MALDINELRRWAKAGAPDSRRPDGSARTSSSPQGSSGTTGPGRSVAAGLAFALVAAVVVAAVDALSDT